MLSSRSKLEDRRQALPGSTSTALTCSLHSLSSSKRSEKLSSFLQTLITSSSLSPLSPPLSHTPLLDIKMSAFPGEAHLAPSTPVSQSFPRPPTNTGRNSPRVPPPTDDLPPRPSAIPSGSPRPPQPSSPRAVTSNPVCYFHYGDRHVKARIDREVPLDEIVRQLAASSQLAVAEPAALFALREKTSGILVTEENLTRMLEKGNV
jgi:hypothetical protein